MHFIASEVFPVPPFGGLSSFCSLWIPCLQTSSYSPSTHMDMIPPHPQFWIKTPVRQAINAGEGVEKREPSYTVGGNAN